MPLCVWVMNTMSHAIASTTQVRRAVARFEFTPSMPTFARTEVSAAKTAERSANTNHIIPLSFVKKLFAHALL